MTQLPTSDGRNRLSRAHRLVRAVRAVRGDDRAVSEVVGAILLFGLLMSLLVLIQVNAVPAQNQQVEFEHNQRVQQDMLALDGALLQTGTENVPASASVELAARYPSRFFLVNPGVGSGTIETTAPGTVTVSNAHAPSAPTYWDGDDRTFETRLVRYRPNYREYRNAPATVYEHNTLVNTFASGATVPVDSGSFVDGDQVTLLLVDGQLSTASTGAVAVETTPLSAPARSLTITNETDDGITISVPTTLSETQWESLLADETGANGNVTDVVVAPRTPHDVLTVTLRPGSYRLRMGMVGVSGNTDDSVLGPHYVTADDEPFAGTLREGESKQVTVRISDRFNNPTTGDVTFSSPDGSFVRPDGSVVASLTKSSDESGRVAAVFRPTPGFTGTTVVTAERDFDGDSTVQSRERVDLSIPVGQTGATGDSNEDSVSGINPWSDESVRLESVALDGGANTVTLGLYNNGSVDREIRRVRLLFYSANSGDPAEWGKLNGSDDDQFFRLSDWEQVDQSIVIESKTPEAVTITFDDAGNKDFFGIAVQYNGMSSNYFVQVP
ncbi:hypothetical protein EGH21_13130 [Halomicroarcula sp. F13]|uniref:Big-1 domain-containing protein n=1 Tax=Haloarcula rubra TaxID=2487747 RepID=A0AAW4PTV0_9EURY|nr:hypothetical protein [Halomicroarcula rubra]MBX0323975.1 hypothetical protein [Halomicroarcula rubra]